MTDQKLKDMAGKCRSKEWDWKIQDSNLTN